MTQESEILRELRHLSKISLLANAKAIEAELDRLASTDDRKRIWVLIDGKRMAKDIAVDAAVSERTVNYFLAAAQTADLIEYEKREPPSKLLKYSPPSWIELALAKAVGGSEASATEATQATLEALKQSDASDTVGDEKNG